MQFNLVAFFQDNPRLAFNLLYPQAALKAAGHSSALYFLFRNNRLGYHYSKNITLTEEEIALMIENLRGSQVAGISVYLPFLEAAKQLTAGIKNKLKIPVIWGGYFPTLAPDECIKYADMVCIGEGEETIVELADRLAAGQDPSRIKSLWVKQGDSVIKNSLRPAPADLNALACVTLPPSECHYLSAEGKTNRYGSTNLYYILASRGCRFSCSYCGEPVWRRACEQKYNYRLRSPENIIGELERIKNNPEIKHVLFYDTLFPSDEQWIRRFSTLYKEKICLPFAARMHPGLIKQKDIALLKNAGLYAATISLESGSENIRRAVFNRQISNKQFLGGYRLLREHGVHAICTILVDNPWETAQEKEQALDLLMKIEGKIILELCTLVFFPKHEITERALRQKMIDSYHLEWAKRPRATYLEIFYRRSKEEVAWIATLLLMALYVRLRCFPKKTVPFFFRLKIMRRWPEPAFFLIYHLHELVYILTGGSAAVKRLAFSEKDAWIMRFKKLFSKKD